MLPDRQLLLFLIASITLEIPRAPYQAMSQPILFSWLCFWYAGFCALFLVCWILSGNQVHSNLLHFLKTLSDQNQKMI